MNAFILAGPQAAGKTVWIKYIEKILNYNQENVFWVNDIHGIPFTLNRYAMIVCDGFTISQAKEMATKHKLIDYGGTVVFVTNDRPDDFESENEKSLRRFTIIDLHPLFDAINATTQK